MKKKILLIIGTVLFLFYSQSCRKVVTADEQTRLERKTTVDPPVTYQGKYLTGLDFPIGALGGGVIRMNEKAERQW